MWCGVEGLREWGREGERGHPVSELECRPLEVSPRRGVQQRTLLRDRDEPRIKLPPPRLLEGEEIL